MTRLLSLTLALLVIALPACAQEANRTPPAAEPTPAAAEATPAAPHDMAAMPADEFATLDADKNGQLTRTELPTAHKLSAHFDMLDTDKNGTLSAAEFAAGSGM